MKKFLLLVALFSSLAFGQTTPNLGLSLPAPGSANWNVPLNNNSAILDGLFANGACQGSGNALQFDAVQKLFTCINVNNGGDATTLLGGTWAIPGTIGSTTPNTGVFSGLTLNVTGATQCLHVNSLGVVSGTGSDCGSGSSILFSSIGSGTNTTVAMLVGTGASLGVTGAGTIDATTLLGANWSTPSAIGSGTPNTGAFTSLDGKVVNGVAYSHRYTGATLDVRVNACITDAEAGANGVTSHICSSEGEGGVQTIAAQINVGDVSADPVTWKLPARCQWSTTISDGVSSAIKQFNSTRILGSDPLLRCEVINGSGSNQLASVYTNAGGGYYRASGLVLESKNVPTSSGVVMLVPGGFDGTTYEDMEILNYVTNGKGILVGNTGGPCCTVNFNRITVNNNYTGGIPLDIEANAGGISNGVYFLNSSIDHPAAGLPNIKVNDTSSLHQLIVGFSDIYEETNTADTTTVPNQITGVGQVFINGMEVKSETSSNNAPAISLSGVPLSSVSIRDISMLNFTLPAVSVQNNITSSSCASPPCNIAADAKGNLTQYTTNNDYSDFFIAGGGVTTPALRMPEQSSSPAGVAGSTVMYPKTSDHQVYVKLNNGSELALLTSGATVGIPGAVNITPVTASNPSAEAQLMEVSLSANYFNSLNQPFFITAAGKHTNASGQTPTYTYKAKLCTVSGCGSGTVVTLASFTTGASTASTTSNPWAMVIRATTNAIGASGTLISSANLVDDLSSLTTDTQNPYQYPDTTTSAISLTGALFLDFTITNSSSNAGNSVLQSSAIVAPQSNVANAGLVSSLPNYTTAGVGSTAAFTQNVNKLWGFILPYQITTSQLVYDVTTADNTANNYDLGLFNATTGALVVDLGATAGTTFAPSTGFKTLSWAVPATISAGRYYVALTSNCAASCAVLGAQTSTVTFLAGNSVGSTSGGALSGSVSPPADNWSSTAFPAFVLK